MIGERIIVVGAGVIGLTTAVRLAEAGYEVGVIARDMPLETTSAAAAALWYPYRAEPPEQVVRWATTSAVQYNRDALNPQSGVRLVDGIELRASTGAPWFADALPDTADFSHVASLPTGYADGWQMRLPVIEPAIYLPALLRRLDSLGASVTRVAISELPDAQVVINCSGLASRKLADDSSVVPVSGQTVRVHPIQPVETWLLDQTDEDRPIYVVPRSRDVLVGGTAEVGSFSTSTDPTTAQSILLRATRLVPALEGAHVVGTRSGLRPTRPAVRLETESGRANNLTVHNYGHGGSGWTLAWGCADDVVRLLTAVGRDPARG